MDGLVLERGAMTARPGHALLVPQLDQQVQLLGEQRFVVVEIMAEQRKGFDEGTAARHDLRPAAGELVEGREILEDADGVVRAQHGDGAREDDALRARDGGGQHHRGGGDGVVGAVMLAEAEDIEPHLIGEFDLLHLVPQPLAGVEGTTGLRMHAGLAKRVDAELHWRIPRIVEGRH